MFLPLDGSPAGAVPGAREREFDPDQNIAWTGSLGFAPIEQPVIHARGYRATLGVGLCASDSPPAEPCETVAQNRWQSMRREQA
jgi:hypothetical protein